MRSEKTVTALAVVPLFLAEVASGLAPPAELGPLVTPTGSRVADILRTTAVPIPTSCS